MQADLPNGAAFGAAMEAVEGGATVRIQGERGERVVLDKVAGRFFGRLLHTGWLPLGDPSSWSFARGYMPAASHAQVRVLVRASTKRACGVAA